MIKKSHHTPVYRVVLREALQVAWNEKRFWILAFLASALTTAGVYDVLWTAASSISLQGSLFAEQFGNAIIHSVTVRGGTSLERILHVLGNVEFLAFIVLILLAFGALACIGQAGLVYAIGAKKRGKTPTLQDALRMGSRAIWPVIALNVLALGAIWLLRFLGSLPLSFAIQDPSIGIYAAHLVSFILSLFLIFIVAVIEIFALNALVLQGAHVNTALARGWELLKEHWVVVIETAVLQVIIAAFIWMAFLVLFSIGIVPAIIFFVSAAVTNSIVFLGLAVTFGVLLFVGGLFALTAFTVQFQYATWTLLYRRLGEGGVVPKLHRIFRDLSGSTNIQQS